MVQCLQRTAQAVLNKNSVIAKEGSKKRQDVWLYFLSNTVKYEPLKKKKKRVKEYNNALYRW